MFRQAFQYEIDKNNQRELAESIVVPDIRKEEIALSESAHNSTRSRLELSTQISVDSWRAYAACKSGGKLTELFFAIETSRDDDKIYAEEKSKAVCGQCAVRTECLQFALENELQGTWGGMTEQERFDKYDVKPYCTSTKYEKKTV